MISVPQILPISFSTKKLLSVETNWDERVIMSSSPLSWPGLYTMDPKEHMS